MISKVFLRGCAIALVVLATPSAWSQTREASSSGVLLDRVAATVNDGVVLQSELEEQLIIISTRLREQRLELPPQNVLRRQVLDRLVLQELQMQRANRAGIKVADETVNNALNDVAQANNIKLADLPDALASQGIDYASYREQLRKELALQILRQRDVIGRINVTPREIDQFIERQKKMPSEAQEYNVSHILIAVPQAATPQELEEAAMVDGLNTYGILLRIVLPLSKAVIATMTLFYSVTFWNSWFAAFLYMDNSELYPVTLFLRNIYAGSIGAEAFGADMADLRVTANMQAVTIVLITIPILLVYPFIQRYFVRGVMLGAVKG